MQNWLYDISARMQSLTDTLEMFDGDDTTSEDIKTAIETVYKNEIVPAVQDGIAYIKGQEAQVKAIAEQIARLQALKKSRENRIKRVKEGYVAFLKSVNKKGVETELGNMSVRKTAGSVIVDNVDELPPAYTNTTITVKPNLIAIKNAIKEGMVIEGAHLQNGESLQIK